MAEGFRARAGKDGLLLLEPTILAEEGFIAAFTTRKGGWSPPPYDGLNMGFGVPDSPENVRANRLAVLLELGLDPSLSTAMKQVHGRRIVRITDENAGSGGLDHGKAFPGCDGMFTQVEGAALFATYADCVPVIIADRARRVIGAVHAGWKGTSIKAALALAESMGFEKDRASDFLAAVGPSIGPCCYEIGEDVASELRDAGAGIALVAAGGGKYRADLGLVNASQLLGIGFLEDNVARYEGCTSCEEELFFSHRRDRGRTGRCAAIAAVRKSDG